jgi:hypothetical protein
MSAKHLLEPVKASGGFFGTTPKTLEKTKPTFRGVWVLEDPNSRVGERPKVRPVTRNPGRPVVSNIASSKTEKVEASPSVPIVVEVEWTEDEDGIYEKMSPKFYKLKPGQTRLKEHMDINLLELGE